VKTTLSKLKKDKEKELRENLKLKQKTGIVNSGPLKEDYAQRNSEIYTIERKIDSMREYHSALNKIVERANQI
jgi:hypothetical protein